MADRRSAPSDDTAEASAGASADTDENRDDDRREGATASPEDGERPPQGSDDRYPDDPGESTRETTDREGSGTEREGKSGEVGTERGAGEKGTDGADADRRDENRDDTDKKNTDEELAALRQAVEDKYDFEDFGPEDMAEMSYEEWEAVFDSDSWITGTELLDRVDADLRNRIADRDVFARIERLAPDPSEGEPERLLAYSDEGYALVYPDGSVDGRGTVLRDVKPTVALCSMDEYAVDDPPEGELLPAPSAVREGSGELGNFMLQITAAIQLLAGIGLFVAWIAFDVETIVAPVAALAFVLAGVFLFFVVANARLSDRFRAEEYRNRLRAVGLESGERPDFLPIESGEAEDDSESAS